jgi:hypothetical protein
VKPVWTGTVRFGEDETTNARIVKTHRGLQLEVALPGNEFYTAVDEKVDETSLVPQPTWENMAQFRAARLLS